MCAKATCWKPHCVSVCHCFIELFMDAFKCPALQETFEIGETQEKPIRGRQTAS